MKLKPLEPTGNNNIRYFYYCPGCRRPHYITDNWHVSGTPEAPTVNPSIMVNHNRANPIQHQCHHFIESGKIRFLTDCTHELAGKVVDMLDADTNHDGYELY